MCRLHFRVCRAHKFKTPPQVTSVMIPCHRHLSRPLSHHHHHRHLPACAPPPPALSSCPPRTFAMADKDQENGHGPLQVSSHSVLANNPPPSPRASPPALANAHQGKAMALLSPRATLAASTRVPTTHTSLQTRREPAHPVPHQTRPPPLRQPPSQTQPSDYG